MATGFSQYQQSQLGVSAAKARAISERSMAQFDLGVSALQEKEALQEAVDRLEQIAKEADRNAKRRGRKVSFGRLLGSIAGFAIGGPAGKAALGTALGSLAGQGLAGGFKKYELKIDDSLVPGGIFYGRNREAIKNRIDDLEEATKDLTRAQRQGIAKDTITSYLLGRGLGKLGEAKITEQGLSLDDLLERGEINRVDYLKNVFKSSFDGLSDRELEKLNVLNRDVTPLGKAGNLMGAFGNLDLGIEIPQEMLPKKSFEEIMQERRNLSLGFNTTNKKNSLFQQSVGPIGGMY
tara:strand:+ start:222 stop:1100 length:879 start_codon:yes stop_codon:yes gene_type:complete